MRFDCVSIISVFLVICFESELINSQYVPTNRGYNYDDYLRNNGGQYGFNPGGNTRVIPQGNDNKQYPGFIPPGYYPSGYNPVDPYYDRNKPFDPNSRLTYGYDPIIKLPGVLGSWRPDLQGRERLDAKSLNREVIVSTNYGQVQGFYVYLYDNPLPESGFRPEQVQVERVQSTVSVFLGIPYALPPLKENEGRFKPPRAHPSWQSLHAVDYKPVCPQPAKLVNTANKRAVEMNEDCLYLNIFSPNTQAGRGKLYPVMMYIHGGEFVSGSANSFPGHVMAGFYEVVVVTFNYRLGALGFLSTGDQNSPGNYGLLDQIMALTWVYENIDHFNGDRNSITLFGPDAGAASAGLLMVHPRTYFMVSKVIAQSGSATADWALVQDKWRAMNTSKVFAKHLGCTIESSWKMFHCLKGRGFLELGDVNFKPDIGLVTWGPVIDANITMPVNEWYQGWNQRDWYFLNDTVESLIARGQINRNLAYMSGVTTQEAGYMIYSNASLAPTFDISEKFMEQKIRELVLQYNYTLNPKGVYEAIKFMYTYWPDPQCKTCIRNEYINLLSDFLYVGPHDKITKLLLKQNIPVYLYVQNTTVEALKLPEWCKAYHNIEWYFLIGAPFLDIEMLPLTEKITKHEWTFNDRNMSHFFMKAFTNFAKYGNPTFSEILGMHFDRAVPGQLFYLNINTTFNSSILFNYRQVQSVFWSDYLPTVIGNIIPLYYPPIYDFWWDQTSPIHVAFWGLAVLSMFLLALTVILCMLWISSKRDSEHYFNDEFLTLEKESDLNHGIDNRSHSNSNIYEYRDTPSVMSNKTKQFSIGKTGSTPSLRTQDFSKAASVPSIRSDSMISLKDQQTISTSPRGRRREFRPKTTELKDGIPQTAV
ncbi:fatty acyl-CoA hydrolase precursor, medium chain isoform X2 [Planococcus citri]|uniref:fatty acyl-CoA hydrolase precursor, medium chain isoform X2 n=1 Tax=Planococcus citri TaxID=170843 RepID=UPI0031F9E8A5